MLGIGFIIAHFVAMQKPQQRKYHSSCNRSVHRGTAHGKQRVKVCKRKTPHLFLMRSFLSPYGDGTTFKVNDVFITLFSPPYGDSTPTYVRFLVAEHVFAPLRGWYYDTWKWKEDELFSPPYGEDPLSHGLRRASSPERGSLVQGNGSCKSSPFGRAGAQRLRGFCGDKLKYHENRLLPVL